MTGTERAALRSALGRLRWRITQWHDNHYIAAHDFAEAWRAAAPPGHSSAFGRFDPRDWWEDSEIPWRILRARLALYIRAVLRADRGERGCFWTVVDTWRPGQPPTFRPVRPLWLGARGVER